ncbi:GxGYxYP family putative glycoside hydrolase [Termitidicoccus mucosus]
MNTFAFVSAATPPKGTPPAKLFRIAHTRLSKPELIALTSLQGILAKDSAENLYLDDGSAGYKHWLEILKTTHGTQVEDAASCRALLAHFAKAPAGYLLCRAADQRSLALAGTLAGPLRGIIIDEPLQSLADSLGWQQLHDTREKDYAWLDRALAEANAGTANVGPDLASGRECPRLSACPSNPGATQGRALHAATTPDIIVSQPPGQVWQARDYAVLANAQVVPAPASGKGNPADESETRLAARARQPTRAGALPFILGWGDGEKEDEQTFIGRVSRLGLPLIPSDHARNLSVLSSLPVPDGGLKQKGSATRTAKSTQKPAKKHTVTFVLSDGDNMSWLLFDCPVNDRWFASPARGQVPLGWGMAPALAEFAPGVMQWYYDQAATAVAEVESDKYQVTRDSSAHPATMSLHSALPRDHFIVGPSGNGYFYPSLMPPGALAAHCAELNRLMGLSDLRLVQIIDNDAFERTDLWDAYLSQPNIDGLIYFDYAPYDKYRGRIVWARGKPVVSAAMQLWGSGHHASTPAKPSRNSPDAVAARLNRAPRDPYSEKGYSLVVVHVWTHTVADVAALAARLDPGVEVVAPDEFFRRVQANLGNNQ